MSGHRQKNEMMIGVISDTHGLVREKIGEIFKGVDLIAHAGDVDRPEVIGVLKNIAPVIAVRGNMDRGAWGQSLRQTEVFEACGIPIYMLHNLYQMDSDPKAAGFGVVISGHTHFPKIEIKDDVLFLNPGSAGPRRSDYPISVAILRIRNDIAEAEIIRLDL